MLSIDHIDATALANLNKIGGADLMHKSISRFYKHASEKLESAWMAAKDRDGEGLIREIHILKSGIGSVGASGFVDHVTKIEKAAVMHERNNYHALLEELAAGLITVRDRLNNLAEYLSKVEELD